MSDWRVHPKTFAEYGIRWRIEPEYGHVVEFEIYDDDGIGIEGSCKGDNCMNWNTTEGFCFHFCEPENADQLALMFREVWAIAHDALLT